MSGVLAIEELSFAGEAYPESLFRLYSADERSLFLVAATSTKVLGYIIARLDRWGAEIVSLAVHPSARKRGIGRALLQAAVKRMRRRHATSIRLMVREGNATAETFYRGLGFRAVGRVADYYEDGATGIRMRLLLTKKLRAATPGRSKESLCELRPAAPSRRKPQ
jgi:ribosomal-protein-alanine N-acetyltransferase